MDLQSATINRSLKILSDGFTNTFSFLHNVKILQDCNPLKKTNENAH